MRWDITVNVNYCCLTDDKYVQCSVHLILSDRDYGSLPPLSTVSSKLQPCNVFACVCILHTVRNTIVIIQFIHKALGLN